MSDRCDSQEDAVRERLESIVVERFGIDLNDFNVWKDAKGVWNVHVLASAGRCRGDYVVRDTHHGILFECGGG
jgi:hypothetical protein